MDLSEKPPQTTASRRTFAGRVFDVRQDEVRWDDGTTAALDIVEHPGSATIIALDAAGALILVRQYRHAAGRYLWELPAGVIEPGETVIAGALRELAEETGYRAARSQNLGACYPTPGYCDEILHFVLAEELSTGARDLDPDERIAVACFPLADAVEMVARGQIADAKTLLAIAWLQGSRNQLLGAMSDTMGIDDTAAS